MESRSKLAYSLTSRYAIQMHESLGFESLKVLFPMTNTFVGEKIEREDIKIKIWIKGTVIK